MDEAKLQEILDDASERLSLGRYSNADAAVHDLVAEVRRLTAALATARREGAEEMRAKCKAVAEASAAHATQVVGGWPRFLVSKEIASEIAALPLDAPGGAT